MFERGAPGGRVPLDFPGHWYQSAVAILGAAVVPALNPQILIFETEVQRHMRYCSICTMAQVHGLGDANFPYYTHRLLRECAATWMGRYTRRLATP